MRTISLLFLLLCSCIYRTDPSSEKVRKMLTNDSAKYWGVKSIDTRNLEQTKIVWVFEEPNKYLVFRLKNDSLIKLENDDERYIDKFKIISDKEILLNGYKNEILFVSKDSLVVSTNDLRYILTPFDTGEN